MAERRGKSQNVSDALREAVQRTVGSAAMTRGRAQEAVDEIVRGAEAGAETVRRSVRSAEAGAGAARDRVLEVLDERRPATAEDVRELHRDVRAMARRLERIEHRLGELEPAGGKPRAGGKAGGGSRAGKAASGSRSSGKAASGSRSSGSGRG